MHVNSIFGVLTFTGVGFRIFVNAMEDRQAKKKGHGACAPWPLKA
jgi:hypothetical protein